MRQKQPFSYLILALTCWITIALQFILILQNRVVSVFETIIRFFTFFTILTNILVAIVFTSIFVYSKNKNSFFLKPNTQSAIAVYIFVVGFVYNIILRFLWKPEGLQRIVDEMLHSIIPIAYIMYWFLYVKKELISWNVIYKWLIYPLVYLIIILILGHFSNYYPYPFVDVTTFGFQNVIINCFVLCLFFVFISVVFVGVAKLKVKKFIK